MRSLMFLLIASLVGANGALANPVRAAFFDVAVIDMSLGADHEVEDRRAAMIGDRLVDMLTESGRFEFVDVEPVLEDASLYANLARCNGCDARFAQTLGLTWQSRVKCRRRLT